MPSENFATPPSERVISTSRAGVDLGAVLDHRWIERHELGAPRHRKKSGGKASAAAKKPKTRKLWGNGKGKFRTRGQYGAATIRGTEWLLQDGCRYTLSRVTQDAVSFRDDVKRKTVIVRKDKSYTARAKC